MSNRAIRARNEGKYPKGDFKSAYDLTGRSFELLVAMGVITGAEWHHTSMYGNRTTFYEWNEGYFTDENGEEIEVKSNVVYKEKKEEVDRLVREFFKSKEPSRAVEISKSLLGIFGTEMLDGEKTNVVSAFVEKFKFIKNAIKQWDSGDLSREAKESIFDEALNKHDEMCREMRKCFESNSL
jgi:hypothetical protein